MKRVIFLFISNLIVLQLYCQNSTTINDLIHYNTINSIGFEWNLGGDDNHNATCQVKYRKEGTTEWKNAMDLFRVDFNGSNMLAGSILFLDAATTYQVELSLSDADGGNNTQTILVTTRAVPQMPTNGSTYYVSQGLGGGTGTLSDPFLGIDAAQAVAEAGDIFILNSGNYGGRIKFTKSGTITNYVVWKAAEDAEPILEGARMIGSFIWLEGVTIQGVDFGLLTENGYEPDGIVITKNKFKDFNYGIQINHGGKNWYITDNVFVGRINDISTGEMSGEGIELQRTSGHVVAYNSISNTADGISYPHTNCDIFRNEIFNVSDDGIEFDYGYANNRAWENRITNSYNNGISFQPMNSAPAYVIRNQVIVSTQDVLKLRDDVDRVLLAHNTMIAWSGTLANSTKLILGFQSNNNLWISASDRYVWEDMSSITTPDWRTNLNYDGFDWGNNTYAFKWKNTRYTSLEDFQTASGLELNGIRVQKSAIFESFDMPTPPNLAPFQYLRLKEACNAIDAGITLNNINEAFTGEAPDLGAFEYGKDVPHYGSRDGTTTSVSIVEAQKELKTQNYPNPFSTSTIISYNIPNNTHVEISVYDLNGEKIRTLLNEMKQKGQYELEFFSKKLVSGIYFYELSIGGVSKLKKMIIQK